MASAEIEQLLSGPLVTWFVSCLQDPESLANYSDLVDGVLLHDVFLHIDPEPLHDGVVPSGGSKTLRTKNLECVVRNMKLFYEEELGHLIIKEPDIMNLGKDPESHVQEAQLLLLLLLGCAVQCPNKKRFITGIKNLNLDTQLAIVDCIKQITDQNHIVMTHDAMESANMGGLFKEIKQLMHERDLYRQKWRNSAVIPSDDASSPTSQEPVGLNSSSGGGSGSGAGSGVGSGDGVDNKIQQNNSHLERQENHHFAVELADWKSKVRKQRQELEEKTEALLECKEELEHGRAALLKLKQQNQELMHEARTAKSYRDELDAVSERAERADRLEMEVTRYREKLTDIEFYKTRIEELREDNRVLMENREMLEEQLSSSRRRADKVLELEAQIIEYKQLINNMALERTAEKEKYQQVCEENSQLHRLKKAAAAAAAAADEEALAGSENEDPGTSDNRLSEQLTNNAQTRALKLELENRRLIAIIDSLKENSFHETSSRVLELEKEKKKLSLKIESLSDGNERLFQQNSDLELVCKQALEENKKFQNTLVNQKACAERQQQEYQTQQAKIVELENNYDTVIKEKQRIQSLLESVQRRADHLDRSLEVSNQKVEELKDARSEADNAQGKCQNLESKIATLEKDKETALRDIHRYRQTIEEKDVALDKASNNLEVLQRKVSQLEQELGNSVAQITRLQEIERSSKELDSRAAIDRETLEALQSNLVTEKLNSQQVYTVLEKLGLSIEILLTLPTDDIFQRIAKIPEVVDFIRREIINEGTLCEKTSESQVTVGDPSVMQNLQEIIESQKREIESLLSRTNASQVTVEQLKSEKAKLQVSMTTLQSQTASLTAQHTALQLANSQLVAEKEELLKDRATQQRAHNQLMNDQVTLQCLHEQLNNEYENLLQEREVLKGSLRDVKNSTRTLRETCERLEINNKSLNAEQEMAINNVKSLSNLRGEHSKLKDDFRNLYTAMEKLKLEYRNLQDDYRKNKIETNRLSLKQTELQGELCARDDRCAAMELEINKLNQRCEMLLQTNSGLDSNIRSLMGHISLLFSQYHELLTHSLEDKEHYHMEEKLYTDKVNHLYRQKEKLEEKIMEHYGKLESCSTKKKRFGASLVKRMRKASSELLSMNRRSWADDSKQLDSSKTYESESGGNESDASIDIDKRVVDSLDADALGHPGTRRTVYYTDDLPGSPATSLSHDEKLITSSSPLSHLNSESPEESFSRGQERRAPENAPACESRPFLIYNKVSATINETKSSNATMKEPEKEDIAEDPSGANAAKDPKTRNPVWYEYGCV